jgi:AraC-like DNA-binding protein
MDAPMVIATAYARVMLRLPGLDGPALLAGTPVDEHDLETLDFMDWRALAAITRNVDAASDDPAWAARAGQLFNVSAHGPLGFAALSAPTLGDALAVMAEFYPVRITTITASLETHGNRTRFSFTDLTGDRLYREATAAMILKVLQAMVETIVTHPTGDAVRLHFESPPPGHAAALPAIYGAPCDFNQAFTGLTLPTAWLHIPSPLRDDDIYRANIARCRQVINGQLAESDTSQRVRNLLANHFDALRAGTDSAPPTLEAVAGLLHLTPRTLIRRLRQHGCTFRELLAQARLASAQDLLRQAHLTVADVAERLGYADPANFSRAFRQWTGTSPAAWRRAGNRDEPARATGSWP